MMNPLAARMVAPMLLAATLITIIGSSASAAKQSSHAEHPNRARWLLAEYEREEDRLSLDEKLARLQQIIDLDPQFARAYVAQAQALLESGRRDDRIRALRAIDKAVRLAPKDPAIRYSEGLVYLQLDQYSQRTRMARRAFEKAVALKPDFGEAHYQLGLLADEAYLEARHVVRQFTDWDVSFAGFAETDKQRAEAHYLQAARYLANPAPAYWRLGALAFETRDYGKMLSLMRRAIHADSTQSDYYLLAGLACYFRGEGKSAARYFRQARQWMDAQTLAVFDSIEFVLSPQMAEKLKGMGNQDKAAFRRRFWQQRDPLYLTEENERLLEHQARLAYANLRFTNPHTKIPGYATDAGQTLIRYGFPAHIVASSMSSLSRDLQGSAGHSVFLGAQSTMWEQNRVGAVDDGPYGRFAIQRYRHMMSLQRPGATGGEDVPRVQIPLRGDLLPPGIELWDYGDFRIPFERAMNGSLEFARGVMEADGREVFRRQLARLPERSTAVLPGKIMPLYTTHASFRNPQGATDVLVFAGFPASIGAPVTLSHGVFLFDSLGTPVASMKNKSLDLQSEGEAGAVMWVQTRLSGLRPGRFAASVEVIDRTRTLVGVERGTFTVRDFRGDSLQMSDVLLAEHIQPAGTGQTGIDNLIDYRIFPRVSGQPVVPGERLELFYEVYNLQLRNHESQFQVEISLMRDGIREGTFGGRIDRLLHGLGLKRADGETVAARYVYSGSSPQETLRHVLQIPETPPGDYRLVVRVIDLQSGQRAKQSLSVRIETGGKKPRSDGAKRGL